MKKTILTSAIALIITGSAFAQPVSDRAVVPIGVTLQQILRLHVIDGGNVEFVFNDLTDYTTGISNSAFYDTRVVVASSTDWQLHLGAESATMEPTDNPANAGITSNNVGFIISFNGAFTVASTNYAMGAAYANANVTANGLRVFTGTAADLLITMGVLSNAGSTVQNDFTLNWECGTLAAGTNPMAATTLLVQSPAPDRYTTNAFLDIEAI